MVCLLILSPGIPEYLSSSSTMAGLIVAPPAFFLFLALNLALYGPGVLLIREATVRWKKGWATVILLGTAYAILEEGIALSTLFNSYSPVVGSLGFYGHWLAVNWVWIPGVVMVHVVFSIGLPILLLGLALPETRGKRLLTDRQVGLVTGILALDVLVLMAVVVFGEHFWMGLPIFIASLAAIGVLVVSAYRVPARLLTPKPGPPGASPVYFGIVGFMLLFGTLLIDAFGGALGLPAAVTFAAVGVFFAFCLVWVWEHVGSRSNERQVLGFVTGALACITIFGILASIRVPVVLVADAAVILFLRMLWARLPTSPREGTRLVRSQALG